MYTLWHCKGDYYLEAYSWVHDGYIAVRVTPDDIEQKRATFADVADTKTSGYLWEHDAQPVVSFGVSFYFEKHNH